MKAYLAYVREESKGFFDAGLSAAEAARRIDLGPYEVWDGPERVFFNVERAYRELRGEPADCSSRLPRSSCQAPPSFIWSAGQTADKPASTDAIPAAMSVGPV